MGARRKFTAEYKREAVAMLEAPGVTVRQIATDLGIGATVLGRRCEGSCFDILTIYDSLLLVRAHRGKILTLLVFDHVIAGVSHVQTPFCQLSIAEVLQIEYRDSQDMKV